MRKLFDIAERNIGNVQVKIWAEEEYDRDLSWDDIGEVAQKIRSGEWIEYCAVVTVHHVPSDLHSKAYLGGCIDAWDGTAVKNGYMPSMVADCVADIRRQISRVRNCNLKGVK
jgi:hypothetical protein